MSKVYCYIADESTKRVIDLLEGNYPKPDWRNSYRNLGVKTPGYMTGHDGQDCADSREWYKDNGYT